MVELKMSMLVDNNRNLLNSFDRSITHPVIQNYS